QDGGYVQRIKRTDTPPAYAEGFPSAPEAHDLTDATVSVRAAMVEGQGPKNAWGVVCRAGNNATGYYFAVSAASEWAIVKIDGSENPPFLDQGTDTAIKPGRQENEIRADCVGGEQGVILTMFVNGTKIRQVTDTDSPYVTGTIGLMTVGKGGLVVGFDDIEVKAA